MFVPAETRRAWLWPNLLSLDAPLVAVLWQVLFARCFHTAVNVLAAVLLVLAVWLIYAADRVLDAWHDSSRLARHEFYRCHWRVVLPVWSAILAVASWIAWTEIPASLFWEGLILSAGVVVYFGAVHVAPEEIRRKWPKEAAVAILFALGATVATWNQIRSFADVEPILLFSCLCWINCAAIEQWESGKSQWPITAASFAVGLAAVVLLHQHRPVLSGAEAASALAFVFLDRGRERFTTEALRVLADVALLSPLLFLPVAGKLA